MSEFQDEARDAIARYLGSLRGHTGKTLSAIAKELGLAPSTLTNPVNRPEEVKHLTSMSTLIRVSRHTGVPLPPDLMGPVAPVGFGEKDAIAYGFDGDPDLDALIRQYTANRPGVEPWRLQTRALRDFGYLPGDVVVLDQNVEAFTGDIVAINWVNHETKKVVTLWRRYQKPFFVASSSDEEIALPIDERYADVMGVVIATYRPRAGR